MTAIAVILGLTILIGLFIKYTRVMTIITVVLVGFILVIAGGGWGYEEWVKNVKAQRLANIEVKISYDTNRCSSDFPLSITITNNTDMTITHTRFTVVGYRGGYSNPIRESKYTGYKSDLIMEPKAGYGQCWSVPKLVYGISKITEASNPPDTLQWKIEDFRPTF